MSAAEETATSVWEVKASPRLIPPIARVSIASNNRRLRVEASETVGPDSRPEEGVEKPSA